MFIAKKILNISRLHNLLNIIPIQPCYKAKCILNLPQSTILCNLAALFSFWRSSIITWKHTGYSIADNIYWLWFSMHPPSNKLEHSCQKCWPLQHCFISITIHNKFNPGYSNINSKLNIQYSTFISDCGTQLHSLSFAILHKQ